MRIFLVSDSRTGINFFPELEAFLKGKIADAEVNSIFVPFPEDIPAAVHSIEGEAGLVFVFVLYEELDFKVQALLNKLIEIELKGNALIVKAIEEKEFESLDPFRLEQAKQALAEKWGVFIINRLFNPSSFAPKDSIGKGFL